ncbi:hypothetical protein BH23CHL5_BH23CHL5_12890 [soil metagenome]
MWVLSAALLIMCALSPGFPWKPADAQTSFDQSTFRTLQRALEGRLPLLGPESGSAEGSANTVLVIPFDVAVVHFAVQFDCYLAPPADDDIPDCSLLVRRTADDNGIVVSVASDGAWFAGTIGEDPIQRGTLRNQVVGGDFAARMSLFAIGDLGYFSVNNVLVDVLDLSGYMVPGSIAVGTGFSPGVSTSTRVLSVSQMRIWSFDDFSPPPRENTTSPYLSTGYSSQFDVIVSSEPISGPLSGALEHTSGRASFLRSGVELADLAVRLTCTHPERAEDQIWDCGVVFRLGENAEEQFRLIALSSGQWILAVGTDQVVQSGEFGFSAGEAPSTIRIEMVAQGETGWARFNDGSETPLELGARIAAGDVAAGSAFFPDTNVDGERTAYSAFSVWQIGGVELHATPAGPETVVQAESHDIHRDQVLFGLVKESLQNVSPAFGPESGVMRHDPSSITLVSATKSVEAPAVTVECDAVDDGLQQLRDCGILVRSKSDGFELRYVVVSEGFWSVSTSTGETLAQGTVSHPEGVSVTSFRLFAIPLEGDLLLGFNGEFLTRIPNPVNGPEIEVLVGSAFYSETYQEGGEVPYDQFIVWSMADYLAPLATANSERDATPVGTMTVSSGFGQPDISPPGISADPSPGTDETAIASEQAAMIALALLRPLDESGVSGYAVLSRVARSVEVTVLIASQERAVIAFVLPGSCESVDVQRASAGRIGEVDDRRLASATLEVRLTQLLSQGVYVVVVFASSDVTLATPLACGEIEAAP